MKEVRKIFKSEKWINRILFISVVAILVVLVGALPALGILFITRPINSVNTTYGYGYSEDSVTGYGYDAWTGVGEREGFGYGRYRYGALPHKAHPNGSLVKTSTSALVYVIEEGYRRWIVSPTAFESWGWQWADIVTISSAEMASYPTAANVVLRPGTLVRAPTDPKVYLVGFDGQLHWISTANLFVRMGFRWEDIRTLVNSDEITWYTIGTRFTETLEAVASIVYDGQLPDGSLVTGSSTNVYAWKPNHTVAGWEIDWIASPVSFESWGFNWASIRQIPDDDLNWLIYWYTGQNLLAKPGTLIKDSSAPVYVTDYLMQDQGGDNWGSYIFKKRWINSATKFTSLGYRWESIKTVSTSELGLYADATDVR